MKKLILLFILSVVLLPGVLSCGDRDTGPVPVFDVTGSYPEKNLILQDIATVEYLPLETNADFLLGNHVVIQYMDDEVIVTNTRTTIMLFDRRTGKAIRSFSREGRGPGEYLGVGTIAVDMKAGELFVTENWRSSDRKSPMHVYDLQGKHLRTIEISGVGFQTYMHVYDDEYLFFYNQPEFDADPQDPAPYRLISRIDTTYTSLPLRFPNRDHMDVHVDQGEGRSYTVHRGGPSVLKTAEGYVFSEPGVDTIYSWNRSSGSLTPLVARTPAFGSMEYPVAISLTGQTDDYLFFDFGERREYQPGARRDYDFLGLFYDKTDGQFYDGEIINGDYVEYGGVDISNISSNPVSYPVGQFVVVTQAVELVDLYEEGKLQGELAEVAASLKEDDNPVLMIATFK